MIVLVKSDWLIENQTVVVAFIKKISPTDIQHFLYFVSTQPKPLKIEV